MRERCGRDSSVRSGRSALANEMCAAARGVKNGMMLSDCVSCYSGRAMSFSIESGCVAMVVRCWFYSGSFTSNSFLRVSGPVCPLRARIILIGQCLLRDLKYYLTNFRAQIYIFELTVRERGASLSQRKLFVHPHFLAQTQQS